MAAIENTDHLNDTSGPGAEIDIVGNMVSAWANNTNSPWDTEDPKKVRYYYVEQTGHENETDM